MKCEDCEMYDPVEGCYADNPGEDCDQVEFEMRMYGSEFDGCVDEE